MKVWLCYNMALNQRTLYTVCFMCYTQTLKYPFAFYGILYLILEQFIST